MMYDTWYLIADVFVLRHGTYETASLTDLQHQAQLFILLIHNEHYSKVPVFDTRY